jgi:hypothetical protein
MTRLLCGGDFLVEQRFDIAVFAEEGLLDLRWRGLQRPAYLGAPLPDEVQKSHDRLSPAGITSLTAIIASVSLIGNPER